jgi:two-component system CheB/CheR fusion protein
LRAALALARTENKNVRRERVDVRQDGVVRQINFEVIPLRNLRDPSYLVLFEEGGRAGRVTAAPVATRQSARSKRQETQRIAELEADLAETRDYLQSVQEQHDGSNEELQAANEEVQSANEELQSVNEELETSKEELESANEELITVNEEMSYRNVELGRLNNDLINLQASTGLGIVLVGRDLAVRRFSPQAQQQFELLPTDVGRPIGHLRHTFAVGDDSDEKKEFINIEKVVADVITSGVEREVTVRDAGGRWFSLRVRPYLTEDNRVDGATIVLLSIDATKRSEAAALAARLFAENTLATIREPLLVLDRSLRVEAANRAFYRAFSLAPTTTLGQSLFSLGDWRWDATHVRTLLNEALSSAEAMEDVAITHAIGSAPPRQYLLNARRVEDAEQAGDRLLLAFDDVTERVDAQTKIQALVDRLQEDDRRKDEFLAMLAHELRGPLAPMGNMLEVLKRSAGDVGAVDEVSGSMQRQLQQLVRLVDDLLDVNRIRRDQIELRSEPVDLIALLTQVVAAHRPSTDRAKHQVELILPQAAIRVDGDNIRLAQVFGNLLHNAAKYTEPGGRIKVGAAVDGGQVIVTVKDNGIGIAPDMLPRIFEMFTQADDARERAQGGLGLGLPLARRLIELHGGTLEARSEGLGCGTELFVRLPCAVPRAVDVAAAAPAPRTDATLRILVVDDNRDSADSMATLLRLDGHRLEVAYDGPEALQAATETRPDVVLLDIGLPSMTGLEVCRRLRAQSWGAQMTLIAMSGWAQERDRVESMRAGFDAHLSKPPDIAELERLLVVAATRANGAKH